MAKRNYQYEKRQKELAKKKKKEDKRLRKLERKEAGALVDVDSDLENGTGEATVVDTEDKPEEPTD